MLSLPVPLPCPCPSSAGGSLRGTGRLSLPSQAAHSHGEAMEVGVPAARAAQQSALRALLLLPSSHVELGCACLGKGRVSDIGRSSAATVDKAEGKEWGLSHFQLWFARAGHCPGTAPAPGLRSDCAVSLWIKHPNVPRTLWPEQGSGLERCGGTRTVSTWLLPCFQPRAVTPRPEPGLCRGRGPRCWRARDACSVRLQGQGFPGVLNAPLQIDGNPSGV